MATVPDPVWGVRADVPLGEMGGPERDRLRRPSGEVVLVLEHPSGSVWLHTKDFYPAGVYRLATGGTKSGESPDAGFARELAEETGIAPSPRPERLAVIEYRDARGEDVERYPFRSWCYRVRDVGDPPLPADEGERIAGWRLVRPEELRDVAAALRALAGDWRPWGEFRAAAHDVVAGVLDRERPLRT